MEAPGLEAFLPQFGIAQRRTEQGRLIWIIDVITDGAEDEPRSAYFDERLGAWKLQSLERGRPSCTSPTPGTVVRHPWSASAPRKTDWTNALHPSEHAGFLLSLDWAATPLGPLKTWPRTLQLYTHMLLSDSRAAAIYWGPQRIAIYNDPLIAGMGGLHSNLMGRSFQDIMPSLWDSLGPLFHTIEKEQRGFARNGLELSLMRHEYLEETWWDGALIPLKDDHDGFGGVYFTWTEVTRIILRDRWEKIINQLGNLSATITQSFWQHTHDVFTKHPRDIPMAVMYSTDENDPLNGRLHLECTIATRSTYAAAPSELHITSTNEDTTLARLLQRAQNSPAEFITIDLSKEDIHSAILEDIDWLGFGEPSRYLVVIPLRDRSLIKGYIILGLNPRRSFDDDHEQFVTELVRQLKETMINAKFRNQSQEREDELTTELSSSERRVRRLAEIVPVGIYELSADGSLIWANNQFFEVMGVSHEDRDKMPFLWENYIAPEDHHQANEKMTKCLLHGDPISDSLRLKRDYKPPGFELNPRSSVEPFWILYSALPNYGLDGSVLSLTGSITDISHLKWAELLQMRNAEAARKEKQVQEEFIDITSHEMRNPLSAITQSADSVLMSLQDAKGLDDVQSLLDIIKLNAEAAESILFCAAHQRRIIDDVLTLGKLDSNLLNIFHVAFQPKSLVDQAMQMFSAEFEANNISAWTTADAADDLTVFGDSSRLLQILVNLMTNAIKFTKTQTLKEINIRYGLSSSIPSVGLFGQDFRWFSTGLSRLDLTQENESEQGPPSYLYFAVTDTGKGILSNSLERIFTKFEQAERRTHISYGGSGLGLYISRELAELQGGRIGIESTVEVGSTFAFYAKVRGSETPMTQKAVPVNQVHSRTEAIQVSKTPALNNNQTRTASSLSSTNYNILLVEDNLLNQKVLAKQLKRLGCNVQVSSNGGEAVDIMLRMYGRPSEYGTLPSEDILVYFDCILMDWEMPICDGIQATKIIRQIESQQAAARNLIIGVTANARAEQVAKAMEAGMDSVVTKPFRVAELLVRIGGFVNAGSS